MEETCNNCDNAYSMIWNNQAYCKYGTHGDNSCHKPKMYQLFILRRDKRKCDNCSHPNKYRTEAFHCYRSYEYGCVNWISKPITEKEPTKPEYTGCLNCEDFIVPLGSKPCKDCAENNHENFRPKQEKQMKEYRPTSKCTLKNIADKINETGYSEAKAEFFDFMNSEYLQRSDEFTAVLITSKFKSTWGEHWKPLISTEKRRNWLSEHGFIEPIHDTSVYEDSVFYRRDTNKKMDWSFAFHKGGYLLVCDSLTRIGRMLRFEYFPIDIKELLNQPDKYYTKRG